MAWLSVLLLMVGFAAWRIQVPADEDPWLELARRGESTHEAYYEVLPLQTKFRLWRRRFAQSDCRDGADEQVIVELLDEYFWRLEQRQQLDARQLAQEIEWLVRNRAVRVSEEKCLPRKPGSSLDLGEERVAPAASVRASPGTRAWSTSACVTRAAAGGRP